jgi:sugar O-acyltransferase (sialic acid O-acetyltransferase NeuD family)
LPDLILIGGGGHCRSVLASLLRAGRTVGGILDPGLPQGSAVMGIPVLGGEEILQRLGAEGAEFIVTVGSVGKSAPRNALYEKALRTGLRPATHIAASATVMENATVGAGSVVLEGAIINTGAIVGINCIVNTGAIIEHDVTINDHAHLAPGCVICGGAAIGSGAFIGAGATVIQGVTVGADAVVGAGAAVVSVVSVAALVRGVPARPTQESD